MSVVPINSRAIIATAEPNEAVVKELERLLEMAKSGEVLGIAIATVHPGDLTCWRRCGHQTRGLIGVIELMQYDMCKCDFETT